MNQTWNLQQTPHTSPYQASLEKTDRPLTALHYITALAFPFIYLPNSPILCKVLCIITYHRHSNAYTRYISQWEILYASDGIALCYEIITTATTTSTATTKKHHITRSNENKSTAAVFTNNHKNIFFGSKYLYIQVERLYYVIISLLVSRKLVSLCKHHLLQIS